MAKRSGASDKTTISPLERRLIDGGLSSASLFLHEVLGCETLRCRYVLATDMHALYAKWCKRRGIPPLTAPRFVGELRKRHGIPSERLRYLIDGRRYGPHAVLELPARGNWRDAEIAEFRRFATSGTLE